MAASTSTTERPANLSPTNRVDWGTQSDVEYVIRIDGGRPGFSINRKDGTSWRGLFDAVPRTDRGSHIVHQGGLDPTDQHQKKAIHPQTDTAVMLVGKFQGGETGPIIVEKANAIEGYGIKAGARYLVYAFRIVGVPNDAVVWEPTGEPIGYKDDKGEPGLPRAVLAIEIGPDNQPIAGAEWNFVPGNFYDRRPAGDDSLRSENDM